MKTIRCRFRKAANFSGGVLYSVSMLLSLGWSVAAIVGRAAGGFFSGPGLQPGCRGVLPGGRTRACRGATEPLLPGLLLRPLIIYRPQKRPTRKELALGGT